MNEQDSFEKTELFKLHYYIEFNNKMFAVMSSKQTRLYILEYNEKEGTYNYPTLEDYIKYYKDNTRINYVKASGSVKEEKSTDNKIPENKLFRFIPKVLYKGQLIGLAAALFMTGCAFKASPEDKKIDYLQSRNIVAEYQHYDEDVILINECHSNVINRDVIYCRNLDEVKKYMNIGTKTYDDVIKLYETKTGITPEQRTVIINGLKRMKKELPNLDVTVLYYNSEMVSFKKVSQSEMNKILGYSGKDACFDFANYIVYYNPDHPYFTDCEFLHEVLGHGSMDTLFINPDISPKAISYGFQGEFVEFNSEHNFSTSQYGASFSEAACDYIAKVASGSYYNSMYEYSVESLVALSEMTGVSVEELLNMRGPDFYLCLHEKANIDNPIETTLKLDQLINDYLNYRIYSRPNTLNDIFSELYVDYSEERVEK